MFYLLFIKNTYSQPCTANFLCFAKFIHICISTYTHIIIPYCPCIVCSVSCTIANIVEGFSLTAETIETRLTVCFLKLFLLANTKNCGKQFKIAEFRVCVSPFSVVIFCLTFLFLLKIRLPAMEITYSLKRDSCCYSTTTCKRLTR